jgi:hypothetical protein
VPSVLFAFWISVVKCSLFDDVPYREMVDRRLRDVWRLMRSLCVAAFDELSLLPVVQWTHRSVTRYGRGVFCAAKLHVPIFSGSL